MPLLTNEERDTDIALRRACNEVTKHLNAPREIDWEQRRYEIAKDVMSGWAASTEGLPARDLEISVDYAIEIANELIRQLKAQEK